MVKRGALFALVVLVVAPPDGTGSAERRHQREKSGRKKPATRRSCGRCTCFTDVYGPRVTGSPNHKAAAEWAIKQMAGPGGFHETDTSSRWDFGHPGWVNERFFGAHPRAGQRSAHM